MSDASVLHDRLLSRAESLNIFTTIIPTEMQQVQPEQLPLAAIFFREEMMQEDGDGGEPHFLVNATYGIQLVFALTDEEELRSSIDAAMMALISAILTDPVTLRPIERVVRLRRRIHYTFKQEMPAAHADAEIVFQYHNDWPPVVLDDLEVIHITTKHPPDASPGTPTIEREYDVTQ